MGDDLVRVVIWKNLLLNGTDYCALWRNAEGWLLKGTVIGVMKELGPMLANYEVHCDVNWLTHRVNVERVIGNESKILSMSAEKRGEWRSSNGQLPELDGCLDVDLALTPATNTLPIRRLNMKIGQAESLTAAWVKLPDLSVQPLSQRYTRLSKNIYRYESTTGFSADITVDDLGLVNNYPGGWTRIAQF